MDTKNIYYCSADGDNIGNIVGKSFLSDNIDQLKNTVKKIEIGGHLMRVFVMKHRGEIINIGGDEGVFAIPEHALIDLEQLRDDYRESTGFTLSIGVGRLPSESAKSLLAAKIRGKNQIAIYSRSVKDDIRKAKMNVKKHKASIAEQKLAEAGLFKSETFTEHNCPYCKQTDGVDPEHCKSCHDLDDNCPFCKEANPLSHDCTNDPSCPFCQEYHEMDGHDSENCPLCQGSGDKSLPVKNPTTTSSENYEGQALNEPEIPKPDAISENPDGLAPNYDSPTNENLKLEASQSAVQSNNIPEYEKNGENITQSPAQGGVQSVLDQVDALPPTEDQKRMESGDPNGPNMINGVLRPDDYQESHSPGDMGLQEDPGPDMSDVLREGLDSHASNIQREKVIQMVGQALSGFKESKMILEKAKIQAPQLYNSSIAMLKAMIEMAKMLGLGGESILNTPNYEPHPDSNVPNLGESSPIVGSSTPNYEQNGEGEPAQADPKPKG